MIEFFADLEVLELQAQNAPIMVGPHHRIIGYALFQGAFKAL